MGLTPQTGLPQNNRVGDFDIFALLKLLKQRPYSTEEDPHQKLGKQSGLLGVSGVSNDMRDIEKAAADGNARAKLAIDVYRRQPFAITWAHIPSSSSAASTCIAFTAGIGENGAELREAICADLDWAGREARPHQKQSPRPGSRKISSDESKVAEVWVIPANEELIVATADGSVTLKEGYA